MKTPNDLPAITCTERAGVASCQVAEGTEVEGTFVQPTALGIDNSDPSSGGRRVRIVVSEGRKHEVKKHPPGIEMQWSTSYVYQNECRCYQHASMQTDITMCSQELECGQVVRHRAHQIAFSQHVHVEFLIFRRLPDPCVMVRYEYVDLMLGLLHIILHYLHATTLSGYLASTAMTSDCAAGARALSGGGPQSTDLEAHPHWGLPVAQGAGAGSVHAAQGHRHQAHPR